MSPGSAAHNASKTALTRATASSPPPSGTHIRATLLNATLQRPTVAGVHALTPKTLKAFPVRMRAADGQNAGGSFANGRRRVAGRTGGLLLALRRRGRAGVRLGGVLFLGLVGSPVLVMARVAGGIVRRARPVMLRAKVEIRDHRERDLGHGRGRHEPGQTNDESCGRHE